MTFRRKQKDTISRKEFQDKLDDMGVEYRIVEGEVIPIRFWGDKCNMLPVTFCDTKEFRIHRGDTLKEIQSIHESRMESDK